MKFAHFKPFYTFLGMNNLEDTVDKLFHKSLEENIEPKLSLIPEVVVNKLNSAPHNYEILEDIDNFDYVFSLNNISELPGHDYKKQRNLVTTFLKKEPNYKFGLLNVHDPKIQQQVTSLCDIWYTNKINTSHPFEREREAIHRAIKNAIDFNLVCLGIWIDDDLVAFSISELLNDSKYVIAHYRKADISHYGIYQFFENQTALYLRSLGAEFMNFEQDLGDEGLRKSKTLWRPVAFLKKYTITPKEDIIHTLK